MTVQLRMNASELIRTLASPVAPKARGGIARGTVVLTARGETPVEALRPGDRVITRERGMVAIRAITPSTEPVCAIRADSLGLARPERGTVVSSDQHLVVRDWRAETLFGAAKALVPAARVADGHQIATSGEAEVFRLDLGAVLTIYANGLETPTGRTETGVIDASDA